MKRFLALPFVLIFATWVACSSENNIEKQTVPPVSKLGNVKHKIQNGTGCVFHSYNATTKQLNYTCGQCVAMCGSVQVTAQKTCTWQEQANNSLLITCSCSIVCTLPDGGVTEVVGEPVVDSVEMTQDAGVADTSGSDAIMTDMALDAGVQDMTSVEIMTDASTEVMTDSSQDAGMTDASSEMMSDMVLDAGVSDSSEMVSDSMEMLSEGGSDMMSQETTSDTQACPAGYQPFGAWKCVPSQLIGMTTWSWVWDKIGEMGDSRFTSNYIYFKSGPSPMTCMSSDVAASDVSRMWYRCSTASTNCPGVINGGYRGTVTSQTVSGVTLYRAEVDVRIDEAYPRTMGTNNLPDWPYCWRAGHTLINIAAPTGTNPWMRKQ